MSGHVTFAAAAPNGGVFAVVQPTAQPVLTVNAGLNPLAALAHMQHPLSAHGAVAAVPVQTHQVVVLNQPSPYTAHAAAVAQAKADADAVKAAAALAKAQASQAAANATAAAAGGSTLSYKVKPTATVVYAPPAPPAYGAAGAAVLYNHHALNSAPTYGHVLPGQGHGVVRRFH